MHRNTIIVLCILFCCSSLMQCFFWVPNRYTAPFWCGDTHITNHFIDSWDMYVGTSWEDDVQVDYATVDFMLSWYQTITAGFFIEATMPLTSTHPRNPDTNPLAPLKNGVCYENCTVLAGWGINYDRLPTIDFIDFMLRIGVVTPAHQPSLAEHRIETIYGYPAWGIPIAADAATGFCNWMTFGLHASVCPFMNSALAWELQPYFKIDHFLVGLSAWFGYSYTGAQHDCGSKLLFAEHMGWHMHTLHYGFEYECIQSYFPLHPRLGFYVNQHVGGKHILHRSNFGATIGLDVTW